MSPKKARCPGARGPLAVLLALGLTGPAQAASYVVRPEIDVEQTYDDNVLSEEDELDSWGTRIAPTLGLNRTSDTSEAALRVGVARRNTYSVSELDGTDKHLTASARRSLSRRLSVGLRGNYAYYASYDSIAEVQPNGIPQVIYADRPELTWSGIGGNLAYQLDDSTELSGEVDWNDYEYDDTIRRDLFDNEDRSASLTLTHDLTALDKLGASLGYSLSEEDPTQSFFLIEEFHTRNQLGTLTGSWQRAWSPRWSTSLQGGVRTLDTELEIRLGGTPFREKFSDSGTGFVGAGTIQHAYSDRGRISFSNSHDTRTGTTSSTGSSAVDTDRFSLTVTHNLAPRLSLSLSGSYLSYQSTDESVQANTNTPFSDDTRTRLHTATIRFDWQLLKYLAAYARFDYSDSDQELRRIIDPNQRFDRRVYGVGFRYFFDHEL